MVLNLTYLAEKNLILVSGRTDPPACGDLRSSMRPGDVWFGKSFDDLKGVMTLEVDSRTGDIVTMIDRPAFAATPVEIPDFLRKKKVSQ